jgi:hypothetical protein
MTSMGVAAARLLVVVLVGLGRLRGPACGLPACRPRAPAFPSPCPRRSYQCYLRDAHARLLDDLERSHREGVKFGCKLVRGEAREARGLGARGLGARGQPWCGPLLGRHQRPLAELQLRLALSWPQAAAAWQPSSAAAAAGGTTAPAACQAPSSRPVPPPRLPTGAYMHLERARASQLGYQSPVWDTLEQTHSCYDSSVAAMLRAVAERGAEVMVASHNQRSVELAVGGMARLGLEPRGSGGCGCGWAVVLGGGLVRRGLLARLCAGSWPAAVVTACCLLAVCGASFSRLPADLACRRLLWPAHGHERPADAAPGPGRLQGLQVGGGQCVARQCCWWPGIHAPHGALPVQLCSNAGQRNCHWLIAAAPRPPAPVPAPSMCSYAPSPPSPAACAPPAAPAGTCRTGLCSW